MKSEEIVGNALKNLVAIENNQPLITEYRKKLSDAKDDKEKAKLLADFKDLYKKE